MTRTGTVLQLANLRRALTSGEAVRLRTQAGLTGPEIAAACGVAPATVWRWEHGQRIPRGDVALKYARLLEQLAKLEGDRAVSA